MILYLLKMILNYSLFYRLLNLTGARDRSLRGGSGTKARGIIRVPKPTFETLPPQVVGEGELEQGGEDESGACAHPDVDGLPEVYRH